jgi:hypothetical protein
MNLNEVNAFFLPILKDEQVRANQQLRNVIADSPFTALCISFTRKLDIAKEKSSKSAPSCEWPTRLRGLAWQIPGLLHDGMKVGHFEHARPS